MNEITGSLPAPAPGPPPAIGTPAHPDTPPPAPVSALLPDSAAPTVTQTPVGVALDLLSVVQVPEKPWWKNSIAIMGYAAQVFGFLVTVAAIVLAAVNSGALPGLPPWLLAVLGIVVAVGAKYGLDQHSAAVRVAELHHQADLISTLAP